MKLYSISIKNLLRHKLRTFLLLFVLVLAIFTFVVLITISRVVNENFAKQLDEYGANILVTPKSNSLSITYGGMMISSVEYEKNELREDDILKIRTIKNRENISVVSPKLIGIVKVNVGSNSLMKSAIICGVNFESEFKLKKWWKILGRKPSGKDEVVIGSEVARSFNLKIGDVVNIEAQVFKVSGILEETGSQDDLMIFADLRSVQDLLKKHGTITLAEVAALCYNCPVEEIVRQISDVLPNAKVTAIKQLVESRMEVMHRFGKFSFGISGIILLISALIIFTNILASVNERTKEIGILRTIGYKQNHIMRVILTEILVISFVSGLLGYLLGWGVSMIVSPILSGTTNVKVSFDWILFILSIFISLGIGIIAGIYPATKASKIDPIVALREI
ncbi:putative ABC transport system permease protein [Candidatus Kryptonium thompsonii]|nr:putative ABC transport system permease protein [Candidatus Kryptonium thompsoni]